MSKAYRDHLLTIFFLVAISAMLSGIHGPGNFGVLFGDSGWKPKNSDARFAELVRDPGFREALRASRSVPPLHPHAR